MNTEEINQSEYDLLLVNVTEELVKQKVKEMMKTLDMCQCKKCYLDACAIVLNKLHPHYVTTRKGSLFSLLSSENIDFHTELTVFALQALVMVKDSPQHVL